MASLPRRFTESLTRVSARPERVTVRASSNTGPLTSPQAYGRHADTRASLPNMSNVVPTPKNAPLIVGVDVRDRERSDRRRPSPWIATTLVTRNVAPTGLAEYAFGSSSWADTGAHVTSTRPIGPMTRAAMVDMVRL